jgi:hypothetical protein
MGGLRGKDDKHGSARDMRSGAFDRGASKEDLARNIVPGDDLPEGLRRKRANAPNKGFRRGRPAKHVPQNT